MKKFSPLVFIALTSVMLVGCSEKAENKNTLVEIGDMVITEEAFYEQLKTSVGEDTLRQMVLERLLEANYEASEAEVQETIKKVKIEQGFKSDAELEKGLQENGVTLASFKDNMRMKILLEKASVDGVNVSEEDVKSEYDRVKNQIRASHILVKERSLAEDLYTQLMDGANFETLAEEYSIDYPTSANGGDLGFFGEDYMINAVEQVAFGLNVDEISQPLETGFGFHLIKVTDKNRSYEELKETLKQTLIEQRKKSADEVFTDLIQKEDVTVFDATLKNALK